MMVSVVYVGVQVWRHLKEELAWTADKWVQITCNLKQLYH